MAFGVEREIHDHDAVLLDDTDQQNDADKGDDGQRRIGDLQRQQRAKPGGGQGGYDGQRVREALIEHAQHDIHRDQRAEDQ